MPPPFRKHVFVCTNERPPGAERPNCCARGANDVLKALKSELRAHGLDEEIRGNKSGCLDNCEQGVSVVVYPEAVWYGGVTVADVKELVEKHLVDGQPVERLRLYKDGKAGHSG